MPFRWIQDIFSDLFSSEPPIPDPSEIQPLTYEAYESLFYQLLDGVARGWKQTQILERLGIRQHDPWFVAWLQRYGRSLIRTATSEKNIDLAHRMVRLGNMDCGELGDVAQQIGERMLEVSRQEDEKLRVGHSSTTVTAIASDDPVELFGQGVQQYKIGAFEGAVSLWEAALEHQEGFFDAHNGCGAAWYHLGQWEKAIAHLNQALEIQPHSHLAVFNRGNVYLERREYDKAIADFNQALEKQGDMYWAFQGRAMAYYFLERYKEAWADFNQALAIRSDFAPAYNGRGMTQVALGEYEQALKDFAEALTIDPNYHEAYHNRGNVYRELGQPEEAIADFTQVVLLAPNFYQAYYSRGNVYAEVGRYQEALKDYEETLTLQPKYVPAYNGQGVVLRSMGRYNDAIDQFNKAVEIDPNFWEAWGNRGWTLFQSPPPLGYEAALKNWNEGLSKLSANHANYPLASGTLHHYQGMAHYREGQKQGDPRPYWEKAVDSYQRALDAWQDDPKLQESYLGVMEELIIAQHHLGNYLNAKNYINIALIMLKQLVSNSESLRRQLRLERQFVGLHQLRIDQLAQSSDPKQHAQALDKAEEQRNLVIYWQQADTVENAPAAKINYAQMQQLLNEKTGLIYWHLSPAAITVFIIRYQQPLLVIPPSDRQWEKFRLWFDQWQKRYERKRLGISTSNEQQWQTQLDASLYELAEILQIEKLVEYFPEPCEKLILVPHRELHLLPIQALFNPPFIEPEFTTISLPSVKIGLDIKASLLNEIESPSTPPLLCVENPSGYTPHVDIEIAAIAQTFPHRRLEETEINKNNLFNAWQTPTNIFHFSGNSYQNTGQTLDSGLILAQEEVLTLKEILRFEKSVASLVCLSACETQLTHPQPITDDFVGLATTFLTKGASYAVHSLWSVPELSTSLLMWQFYQQLKDKTPPETALKQAQSWLRHLTYEQLISLYDELLTRLEEIAPRYQHTLKVAQDLAKDKAQRQGQDYTPFISPYYWAGFTVNGIIQS